MRNLFGWISYPLCEALVLPARARCRVEISGSGQAHTHTHLLRTIFANSDVEYISRAKTIQLYLTGMGR